MPIIGAGGSLVTSGNIVDGTIVNADIASNAAISASKITGKPYEQLDTKVLGAPAASLTTNTFAAKKFLRVFIRVPSLTISDNLWLRFNGDSGANYSSNRSTDQGAATANTGITEWRLEASASTGDRVVIVDIFNQLATTKKGQHVMNKGAVIEEGSGEWINTIAQITSITLLNGGAGNLGTGSEITVLGMD